MDTAPLPFFSFGGYRRFCWRWWQDLARQLTTGLIADVRTYWHRARYGWAPRDTWSLDWYLAGVFGGALAHLAERSFGTPAGYPRLPAVTDDDGEIATDHDQWRADLRRWAAAFRAYSTGDYVERFGRAATGGSIDYECWHADEQRRALAAHQALREMEPWFEALWD